MNGNDLLNHIEGCEKCQTLENLRDKLIDLNENPKIIISDRVFQTITDSQLECSNGN